jgi:hypothetical protein
MSHPGFVITPYDPADESQWDKLLDYELDAETLSEKLKLKWPLALVDKNRDGFRCFIPAGSGSNLVGHISDLTATCPRFPEELIVEFILWYRSFIPDSIPLYIFSFDPDNSLQLTGQTSKAEIVKFVAEN